MGESITPFREDWGKEYKTNVTLKWHWGKIEGRLGEREGITHGLIVCNTNLQECTYLKYTTLIKLYIQSFHIFFRENCTYMLANLNN